MPFDFQQGRPFFQLYWQFSYPFDLVSGKNLKTNLKLPVDPFNRVIVFDKRARMHISALRK